MKTFDDEQRERENKRIAIKALTERQIKLFESATALRKEFHAAGLAFPGDIHICKKGHKIVDIHDKWHHVR